MGTIKYRISMVFWDYKSHKPRSSALVQFFDTEVLAESKACIDAKIVCNRLNDEWHKANPGVAENPFILDENSDCTAIIRFWDGDDYWCVQLYNVYSVVDKGDNWMYRGYRVCFKGNSFNIEKSNVTISNTLSLIDAFNQIDSLEINSTIKNVA